MDTLFAAMDHSGSATHYTASKCNRARSAVSKHNIHIMYDPVVSRKPSNIVPSHRQNIGMKSRPLQEYNFTSPFDY